MKRRHSAVLCVPTLLAFVACAGKREPSASSTDTSVAVPAASAADSTTRPASDSAVTPLSPSAAAAAAKADSAKVEKGDYDRAGRPKFRVDEKTGAITPIKRP